MLNKVVIVCFICAQKVFLKLRKIRVEPLKSHGLFYDLLAMFLSLDRVRIIAVYGRVREFIKNILICVPKMNEGLTGLERHEGE